MQIRNAQDFWSGVMFAAFGIFFMVFARNYEMGTAARMGPAFFPTMLGGLLLLLGVVIGLRGLAFGGGKNKVSGSHAAPAAEGAISRFHFKPLLLVLGAVVAFGLLLRPAGLIISLAVLIVVSSMASDQFRLRDVVLLTVGLTILVVVVFIYGLSMTVPVWPAFMND